jgi:HEAT repeat protein
MTAAIHSFEHYVLLVVWTGLVFAVCMVTAVIVQRIALAIHDANVRRLAERYQPVIDRAMAGDATALAALAQVPKRHRLWVAKLIVRPIVLDRVPTQVAAARVVFRALPISDAIDRYLLSYWWWQRVLGLRGLSLMREPSGPPRIVAALDDADRAVRNAALDALADLLDPATLPAVVVRLHDSSVDRGRVLAAIEAFGSQGEPFLLSLAEADEEHRVDYARALALCGTGRSRPVLCRWTADERAPVRAAAFRALSRIGLDQHAAACALGALETGDADADVRAMAAESLRGWTGGVEASATLARHLDDTWNVAVHAARSLQSITPAGRAELERYAGRQDLAGLLARQMLWESKAGWRAQAG